MSGQVAICARQMTWKLEIICSGIAHSHPDSGWGCKRITIFPTRGEFDTRGLDKNESKPDTTTKNTLALHLGSRGMGIVEREEQEVVL